MIKFARPRFGEKGVIFLPNISKFEGGKRAGGGIGY